MRNGDSNFKKKKCTSSSELGRNISQCVNFHITAPGQMGTSFSSSFLSHLSWRSNVWIKVSPCKFSFCCMQTIFSYYITSEFYVKVIMLLIFSSVISTGTRTIVKTFSMNSSAAQASTCIDQMQIMSMTVYVSLIYFNKSQSCIKKKKSQ